MSKVPGHALPTTTFDFWDRGLMDFTDLICEAAFLPELWPRLLDRLAERDGSRGGVLQVMQPGWGGAALGRLFGGI